MLVEARSPQGVSKQCSLQNLDQLRISVSCDEINRLCHCNQGSPRMMGCLDGNSDEQECGFMVCTADLKVHRSGAVGDVTISYWMAVDGL